MKTKFAAATVLAMLAAPAVASTPISDPFTRAPNGQTAQPAPDSYMGTGNAYVAPFADHLRQNRTDDMRPMDGGSRNMPPRMDASGVPDPRI